MVRSVLMMIACALFTSCCSTTRPAGEDVASRQVPAADAPARSTTDGATPASAGNLATNERAEAAVRQASDRFWSARDQRDAASLAAQFTENGILMVPGLADAVGRSAIRDLLQLRLNAFRIKDFAAERREITVAGDTAYELAWFGETHVTMDGSTRVEGRYVIAWKQEPDGVWRVHRHLSNFSGMKPIEE
jgi:uncharacterized protein (TIGR02246 family)